MYLKRTMTYFLVPQFHFLNTLCRQKDPEYEKDDYTEVENFLPSFLWKTIKITNFILKVSRKSAF